MSGGGAAESVTRLLSAVDRLDWDGVRSLLDSTVRLDYTSLFGGEVETVEREEVIARWRSLLPGFDATQHLTGPVTADVRDGHADCRTAVRAYHHLIGEEGRGTWMTAGFYHISARREAAAWRISAITLEALYEEGDRALTQQAARRVELASGGRVRA
ncbi:hypothetical protein F4561_003773 [Lipingzhangella halophila]|uniref:SnoaL-like domain-containing protein n=1 Tax=Lipingzhangella halophila TaxID=1783352 RepID=A0A7W7W3W2_9ACTN|nr:nuclear transport factor 2 family protein [Lipingzhangella halophila]MBB4932953.1 hypothetical protein [Lipingzhangella halophila]